MTSAYTYNNFFEKELVELKKHCLESLRHNKDIKIPEFSSEDIDSFIHVQINSLNTKKFFETFVPPIKQTKYNDYFKESKYQEFSLLTLCNLMNQALYKSEHHNKSFLEPFKIYSSQFLLVNDIIKYSPELIACLYLLSWQNEVYKFKHDIEFKEAIANQDDLIDEKVTYSLNYLLNILQMIENSINKIRSGNIKEAQIYLNSHKQVCINFNLHTFYRFISIYY